MSRERSPYEPPSSLLVDLDAVYAGLPDAGLGRRFTNYLIDTFAGQVVVMALAVGVELSFPGTSETFGLSFALGVLGLIIYYSVLEAGFGRTVGKLITGTRVVADDGTGPPSVAAILGRTLARLVPFEGFSFFGSESPRGWHDTWSGTRVVNLRAVPTLPGE